MTKNSFENNMKKIEKISQELEKDETGLEKSLKLFNKATKLIKDAKGQLNKIEHDFQVLKIELEVDKESK